MRRLDGRKEINDRVAGRYAAMAAMNLCIVPKFQKLVEARGGKNYYMRGTFTHANTDFTNDILHMADLGFTELECYGAGGLCPRGCCCFDATRLAGFV